MTISQRIFAILKEKNLKQKALAKKTGISESAISDWKKKGTNPASENISAIAEFLGVSLEYLVTGKEKKSFPKLSENEQKLINYYKDLPGEGQLLLLGRAAGMLDVYSEQVETAEEPEIPMIKIRHSYYKVSAGTGYDLDDSDQWDEIEIPDTRENRRADFALTISGNSMEPVYYDGDIVLVKEQPEVNNGEIGIFIIEKNGFIKKYGGDRLISLNAEYEDILFSDYDPNEIYCSGLVIGRV